MANNPAPYRIQALSIFESDRERYTIEWVEDLFSGDMPRELVVTCTVCTRDLRIRGTDAIGRGGKLDSATRGALARFREKHDKCDRVVKKPKTKGAQQRLPGLG